ncbi:MAG: transporter substrate-binding domain-containing protein [Clostridia bacterium]|nr:transporter substrate-binding domain-containing protein [Clostridia bacterium]
MKKLLAIILAITAIATCFVGCGKKDKKEVIVVGYTLYEPMNYLEDGELVGFDTELAKEVFENLGYEVVFKKIEWSAKYTDLKAGTIDCIWNGFTCNVADDDDGIQRSEKVDFSYNYMENRQAIVVKKDSGIAAAADLKGKRGAYEAGSAGKTYANSFEGIVPKEVVAQTDAIFEVNAGTADFAVVDIQLARSYAGTGDYANLVIAEDLSSDVEYYAIGFKKGSKLTEKVNEQLEKLGEDGTIEKLAKKYGVENTAITDYSDQKK